jgi:hypothetical protein
LVLQPPKLPTKEEMSKVLFKGPPPKRAGEVQAEVQPKPKALRVKSPPPGIDDYKPRQTAVEVKAAPKALMAMVTALEAVVADKPRLPTPPPSSRKASAKISQG